MQKYLKFAVASNPLQGLRLVDTFPWLMIFTPKTSLVKSNALPLLFLCVALLFVASFISTDIRSTLKLLVFFFFTFLFILSKPQKISFGTKSLFLIFFLLVIEDVLINYANFMSPFIRDDRGALFIFREKSYVALFIGFLLSYLPHSNRNMMTIYVVLVGIFIFLQSTLGWFILAIFIYHRFQISRKYFPKASFITLLSLFVIYYFFYLIGNVGFGSFLGVSDSLRFLINLESLNINHLGTFYLHDANQYTSSVIDFNRGYMSTWSNMTPQAPFFILAYYFGYLGWIVATLFFSLYILALPKNNYIFNNYAHSMILINFFLQGFLLSPYIFGYLFIVNKETRNVHNYYRQ
jgi:hypothetical protein